MGWRNYVVIVTLAMIVVISVYPQRYAAQKRVSRLQTPLTPLTPMTWSDEEGAFMVELRVGKGMVSFVLDTGSGEVAAKGWGCVWEHCDGSGCESKSCPCGLTASGRPKAVCDVYIPSSNFPLSDAFVTRYGSQNNTVEPFPDVLSLPTQAVHCADLMGGSSQTPVMDTEYAVVVHRVSRIDGSSSSNLLGTSRPTPSFLTSAWSLTLYNHIGWLARTPLSCFQPMYTPLLSPRAFRDYQTQFYLVGVDALYVGEDTTLLRLVEPSATPSYLLIDTGTTFTYFNTKVGEALDAAGFDERVSMLRFCLRGGVQLTYSAAQLRDPDNHAISIVHAWPGRTFDDFDTFFPADINVCLFGITLMKNLYWEFDTAKQRLGIASV